MVEQRADGLLAVIEIMIHFIGCITLSHKGDMDTPRSVGSLMQHLIGRDVTLASLTDQNVLGINDMSQRIDYFIVIIEQFYLNFHGVFREGHKEYVLKRFLRMLGFFCGEPFLKEGGERVTINHGSIGLRMHGDLSVTPQRQLCQTVPAAIPVG